MKRKIYEKLLDWKKNSASKCALLIEGARRVGKSYVVQEFAKNEYEHSLIILHPGDLKSEGNLTYLPLYMAPFVPEIA